MEPSEPYEQPRPLTEREGEILDFLLSVDLPEIEELRVHAKTALAVRWAPYDASIALYAAEASRWPGRSSPTPCGPGRASPLTELSTDPLEPAPTSDDREAQEQAV